MKLFKSVFSIGVFVLFMLSFTQCEKDALISNDAELQSFESKAKPTGDSETVGNNLSFPVIWSDFATKALNGNMGVPPTTEGEWWYVWGDDPIDPEGEVFSCKPSLTNPDVCEDGNPPGDGASTVYKAYVQKDADNIWQATNLAPGEEYYTDGPIYPAGPVNVDLVDWGDNLESIDWSINSRVRTEVVLYENLDIAATEFPMRHVNSWGIDEVHGLQIDPDTGQPAVIDGLGTQASVFTPNARFTIQKLNIESLDDLEGDVLEWEPGNGWTNDYNLVNDPIFNMAVYEASDGPGYYNAEVNVKGKVIYGYTWNVRRLNDGIGYYRLTFSFDNQLGLNTFFDSATEILLPIEEEIIILESDDSEEGDRGGIAVMHALDDGTYITYMDILIIDRERGQGGNSGNNNGGNNGPGNGNGGNGGKGKK
jgi:hypothetical protein